ncbi:MAG: hypothetical protein P8Y97_16945 [Candidatus Lokiarchaeota archaeon]
MVLEAINKLIKQGYNRIDTARVRQIHGIKASNRSKTNYLWRALEYVSLHYPDIITQIKNKKPKTYRIITPVKINIEILMKEIKRENYIPQI